MLREQRLKIITDALTRPRLTRPVVGHELRQAVLTYTGAQTEWTATLPQIAEVLDTALFPGAETPPPPAAAAGPGVLRAPTAEETEAATRILLRAWAPGSLPPGRDDGDTGGDDGDPDEYCGCAGEDDDGESLGCNCGGGCICEECLYNAYARNGRCWVQGCGKPTAFRVVRFAMADVHVHEATARGAVCPHAPGEAHHCTPDAVYITAGQEEQVFGRTPACSLAHAVQLRDSGLYDTPRRQYRIEAWTYTPHPRDLPAPLPQLRLHARSAHEVLGFAVEAHTRADQRGTQLWLDAVRRSVALAAWHARQPLAHPHDDGDDFDDREDLAGPFQDEPGEPDDEPDGGGW
ncbi:hypothetical protein ABZX40_36495 [Streptomyces sp. NPDC004610]|uniref:hypothetical protein n=1 Tax=unclassified Streptomyces TaxID=2593676 RepID=UPI0033AB33EC